MAANYTCTDYITQMLASGEVQRRSTLAGITGVARAHATWH